MPYTYILECADGSFYTGSTWNLERRLWQHQQGLGANHTAKRLPVKLVYCEVCDRIDAAFQREKQIQGWSRKKKLALIAGNENQLHVFAQCQNESHHKNYQRLGDEDAALEILGGGAACAEHLSHFGSGLHAKEMYGSRDVGEVAEELRS